MNKLFYLLHFSQRGNSTVPNTESTIQSSNEIPDWIKTNAGWWADGQMSDESFLNGIQWMIENGIIRV